MQALVLANRVLQGNKLQQHSLPLSWEVWDRLWASDALEIQDMETIEKLKPPIDSSAIGCCGCYVFAQAYLNPLLTKLMDWSMHYVTSVINHWLPELKSGQTEIIINQLLKTQIFCVPSPICCLPSPYSEHILLTICEH